MAGPKDQQLIDFIIPPGEAQKTFAPAMLANEIKNFTVSPEGTLKTIVGPTSYEPTRKQEVSLGDPHGIVHAGLLGGISDTLIIRCGNKLYRHAGWNRGWETLKSGLTNELRPKYPDQFVVLQDKIIWTNGVDRPQIIDHDGMVVPLGFSERPGIVTAKGPTNSTISAVPANTLGYTWPGRIGSVGDILDGVTGSILDGVWYYWMQWEDVHGNLSALSPASNPVRIHTMTANAGASSSSSTISTRLDELTKQFFVQMSGDAPTHAVAIRLHRTPDARRASTKPYLLTRIPGTAVSNYPDNIYDAGLGEETTANVPVPVFKVMCAHQGRLVIGNTDEDPGIVRRSEPGFSGTFPENEWTYPDSGGAAVTALFSHSGHLLAFTEDSVYSLQDFGNPVPLAQGIGCTAPGSIQSLPDGMLVWLSRDGFYGMKGGEIKRLSRGIHRVIRDQINRSRMSMATSAYSSESGEYRCFLAEAGENKHRLVLAFDGAAWRRLNMGLHTAAACTTDDWRQYLLMLTKDTAQYVNASNQSISSTLTRVLVADHETDTFTPPARDYVYRSSWVQADETGITPVNIRMMYIGMIDSWDGDFEVSFYRNGSWKEVVALPNVKAVGVDDGSGVVDDVAGKAVIGTSKVHDPRLFWRQLPVGLENAHSWAFQIKASYPTRLNIAAFAFDISVSSMGQVRGRIPMRDDE